MKKKIAARIFAVGIVCSLAATGCKKENAAEAGTAAVSSYDVRAVVKNITRTKSGNTLLLQHEAIPDFKNQDGKKVGMKSMTMSFTAPQKVSVKALNQGDKVAVSFEVRWQGETPLRVTRLKKLSTSTELKLP